MHVLLRTFYLLFTPLMVEVTFIDRPDNPQFILRFKFYKTTPFNNTIYLFNEVEIYFSDSTY